MRRRMGAAALDMDAASDGSWQTRWRATVASRLPSQRWPQRTVLITAVDAHTGEPVVFDRHSGVDLVDAVAASCASGLRLQDRRQPIHRRRLPIQRRECRSGSRIRTGAGAVTVRRQITGRRWTGARILPHRSTNSARAAAESKRSSRTATPSTCSAPMRWICRCVRPLLELVTTKAEPLPSSSPNSGADAHEPSRLGRRDDTCSCLGGRWARHASRYLRVAMRWSRLAAAGGVGGLPVALLGAREVVPVAPVEVGLSAVNSQASNRGSSCSPEIRSASAMNSPVVRSRRPSGPPRPAGSGRSPGHRPGCGAPAGSWRHGHRPRH